MNTAKMNKEEINKFLTKLDLEESENMRWKLYDLHHDLGEIAEELKLDTCICSANAEGLYVHISSINLNINYGPENGWPGMKEDCEYGDDDYYDWYDFLEDHLKEYINLFNEHCNDPRTIFALDTCDHA